jgi:hypothetical protein
MLYFNNSMQQFHKNSRFYHIMLKHSNVLSAVQTNSRQSMCIFFSLSNTTNVNRFVRPKVVIECKCLAKYARYRID